MECKGEAGRHGTCFHPVPHSAHINEVEGRSPNVETSRNSQDRHRGHSIMNHTKPVLKSTSRE